LLWWIKEAVTKPPQQTFLFFVVDRENSMLLSVPCAPKTAGVPLTI
jgi:hypothetical protein